MKPHVELGLGFLAGVALQILLTWIGLVHIARQQPGLLPAAIWVRPVGTLCATALCVAAGRVELGKGLLLAAGGFAVVAVVTWAHLAAGIR
jgi:hypothetical protein